MITQINIEHQHNWFPQIECGSGEAFFSFTPYYFKFVSESPDSILNNNIESMMKLQDVEFDFGGDSAIMPIFNLEKVYAYMLKKWLEKR